MPETDTSTPTPIEFHWVITVQTERGNIATYDGQAAIIPSQHTPQSIYAWLRDHVAEKVGTDRFIVLFHSIQPNHF